MLFGLGKTKSSNGSRKRGDTKAPALEGASRKRSRLRGSSAMTGSVNKLFHGVAVRSRGEACCDAVDALGAQRFLSEDAPLLPLSDCSNPQGCRCVYVHFDERRDNLRRESDVGLPVRTHPEEKREGYGRRITDG